VRGAHAFTGACAPSLVAERLSLCGLAVSLSGQHAAIVYIDKHHIRATLLLAAIVARSRPPVSAMLEGGGEGGARERGRETERETKRAPDLGQALLEGGAEAKAVKMVAEELPTILHQL
jgi:hypothetical protein